jgi:hypothetical protein
MQNAYVDDKLTTHVTILREVTSKTLFEQNFEAS